MSHLQNSHDSHDCRPELTSGKTEGGPRPTLLRTQSSRGIVGWASAHLRLRGLAVGPALALLLFGGCGGGGATNEQEIAAHKTAEEHTDERLVRFNTDDLGALGIELETASPGLIGVTIELPGEVRVNGDTAAHVAPRVGGVVRSVFKSLGDRVRAGELMAILESRELADTKATFLAAYERLGLAQALYEREERLWKQKISPEQDYLDARNTLAEARIELRATEQKLHALGFTQEELNALPDQHDANFTENRVTAPFNGTVIEKHITLGETIAADESVFTIADLSTVWIDLSVYQIDLGKIRGGQRVTITAAPHEEHATTAVIDFVQPLVGEATRTALARIIMPNPDGRWTPGIFVTGSVVREEVEVAVQVPTSALIPLGDDESVIFVQTPEGFVPRPVRTGRRNHRFVEVLAGLEPGERYVAEGAFSLKAELGKDAFGDGHGH
jgi:cobalt-zinc-cadmium efflux system membrane fusion protein